MKLKKFPLVLIILFIFIFALFINHYNSNAISLKQKNVKATTINYKKYIGTWVATNNNDKNFTSLSIYKTPKNNVIKISECTEIGYNFKSKDKNKMYVNRFTSIDNVTSKIISNKAIFKFNNDGQDNKGILTINFLKDYIIIKVVHTKNMDLIGEGTFKMKKVSNNPNYSFSK